MSPDTSTDPDTVWEGGFPYHVLREVGVGPASTRDEVAALPHRLMRERRYTREAQRACDELRRLDHRLALDFLVYPEVRVPEPAAAPVEPDPPARPGPLPSPVQLAEFDR
jgi:hypothetical protein